MDRGCESVGDVDSVGGLQALDCFRHVPRYRQRERIGVVSGWEEGRRGGRLGGQTQTRSGGGEEVRPSVREDWMWATVGTAAGGVLGVCFSSHTSICASPLNSNDIASSFRGAERHRTTLPRTIFLGAKSGGPWSVSVSFSSLR